TQASNYQGQRYLLAGRMSRTRQRTSRSDLRCSGNDYNYRKPYIDPIRGRGGPFRPSIENMDFS
ncbi:hypothetical protein CEXT_547791, partial [Caerostris extrusa]